ncbi:MAG: peptide deformylase [Candidatus Omnitrophota bacterium]
MATILDIKKYPDKILRAKCTPVQAVNDEIRQLAEDMLFTMRASCGIGLAAPQVGVSECIIVADIGEGPVKLINPKIIQKKGKSVIEEGCLSLPEALLKVKRAHAVKIKALDEAGNEVTIDAEGLLATVIQHEIDHINGILLIDHANFIRKKMMERRLAQIKGCKMITDTVGKESATICIL